VDKRFVAFVVKKYFKFDRSQPFISITAILAFVGVVIGVFVLIVAMAIMQGFDKEFERKLFTMNYPLTVYPKFSQNIDEKIAKALEKQFADLKFSPFLRSSALVKSSVSMDGAIVFGVDFAKESAVNPIFAEAVKGKNFSDFEAVVGSGLKKELENINEKRVTVIFANVEASGLGIAPTMKRFLAEKSFHSGLIVYDKSYIYTKTDDLAKVLKVDNGFFDGIHINSTTPFEDKKRLQEFLGENYTVIGWWQQNGNFFAALALEKRALFIVLMLIIVVASLNIVSSLLMTVMSRRKEIALMLSLGASKDEIRAIFFYLGSIIGGIGIAVGVAFGLISLYVLGNFDLITLPADVYGSSKLPIDLSLLDFTMIVVGSTFVVLFSSYYPAKKASQVDPLTTLRNE
jgi:putative ABC transport system permease protein